MGAPFQSPELQQAALADYFGGTEAASVVAARHGIPAGTFRQWVRRERTAEIGYYGGWEVRGGVRYPLFPERRSA